MAQVTIISVNDGLGIVLPAAALEGAGLGIGDTVEVTVSNRAVSLTPSQEDSRRERFEQISDEIIERRRDAYERLA